jgi:hypothetical protein
MPAVAERGDPGDVAHVGGGDTLVAERVHADTDHKDPAAQLGADRTTSNRNVTSSWPSSSVPTGNRVSAISSPVGPVLLRAHERGLHADALGEVDLADA